MAEIVSSVEHLILPHVESMVHFKRSHLPYNSIKTIECTLDQPIRDYVIQGEAGSLAQVHKPYQRFHFLAHFDSLTWQLKKTKQYLFRLACVINHLLEVEGVVGSLVCGPHHARVVVERYTVTALVESQVHCIVGR